MLKLKIKVKEHITGCFPVRTGESKSDCFDLFLADKIVLKKGAQETVSLGVAMELPKGMVAKVYCRSSTPGNWGVGLENSMGFIDNSYKGHSDIWKAGLIAYRATAIPAGTRICQFEIVPSQFATVWQKLRWLFSSGVVLERVEELGNTNRGGIGSTGK